MGCSHNCSECSSKCSEESLIKETNKQSKVKKVIGIVSGKGGVGKSLVTSMMAVSMQRKGYKTAILDADITGPSIPEAFGIHERADGSEEGIIPCVSKLGTKLMSVNLLLENESDPVVWRGPVIAGTVLQFWTDTIWGDVDFMFVDMPPGTGDVPLTVFQSLPLDGIIIISSPQELVSMIVEKAINMAALMNVNVLGLIENYSYIVCPDCGKIIYPYGRSRIEELSKAHNIDVMAKLPIDPELASLCDKGVIELFEGDYLENAADKLEKLL